VAQESVVRLAQGKWRRASELWKISPAKAPLALIPSIEPALDVRDLSINIENVSKIYPVFNKRKLLHFIPSRSHHYGCRPVQGKAALHHVDLEIGPGMFGLLGPNGAGKTTLINIIAGLARASAGSVAVLGADVVTDYRRARRALGVVPQELVFDPFFTVRETLRFQSGYFGLRANDPWIDEVMHHLDLDAKADANMRGLSGGMKRRVLVAQALVHKPPVIVLDEPTAGVDVELRQGLWQFVRRLNRDGHTIVLTTHYLEEAEEHCQRIAMLKGGHVVALDTTQNLLASFVGPHPADLEDVFLHLMRKH
jgi:ABC-2 type transport system ATP-binding protein